MHKDTKWKAKLNPIPICTFKGYFLKIISATKKVKSLSSTRRQYCLLFNNLPTAQHFLHCPGWIIKTQVLPEINSVPDTEMTGQHQIPNS